MARSTRILLLSAAALALCLCAAALAAGAASGPERLLAWLTPPAATATPPPPISPVPPTPTADPPPVRTPTLSAQDAAAMDELQRQVSTLRGLTPRRPVPRVLLDPADLSAHVVERFLRDSPRAQLEDDVRVLAALGLLEPGFDLWDLLRRLHEEQTAGYYDEEEQVLYVVSDAGFGGPERLTYVHEFVHALQDQHYDLRDGLGVRAEACRGEQADRCAAVRALLEGDATLLEAQWLRTYASAQDLDELRTFFAAFASPVFDSAPAFLQEDVLFPYVHGQAFVSHLYRQGGWAAVEAAYADPPVSTEQILHPSRYPRDTPSRLAVPDLSAALGEGWVELRRAVVGEWTSRLMLKAYLEPEVAEQAAAGWGGDLLLAYHHAASGQTAVLLVTRWDTVLDAQQFLYGLRDAGQLRFGDHMPRGEAGAVWGGPGGFALAERGNDQTIWIVAPEAGQVQALRQAVPFPAPLE